MSRQRLGASFFETITEPCKHCSGTGYIRSVEILAVSILRTIRHTCADKQVGVIYVYANAETISYMFNYKKNDIFSTEKNYNIHIFMHQSDDVGVNGFTIKKRKSLSDEERKEIEMQVTTGKVNQLGLERGGYSESSVERVEGDSENNVDNNDRGNRRNRGRRNNHNKNRDNRRRNDSQNERKSMFGGLFSFLK
jgi:ribonuclease E